MHALLFFTTAAPGVGSDDVGGIRCTSTTHLSLFSRNHDLSLTDVLGGLWQHWGGGGGDIYYYSVAWLGGVKSVLSYKLFILQPSDAIALFISGMCVIICMHV